MRGNSPVVRNIGAQEAALRVDVIPVETHRFALLCGERIVQRLDGRFGVAFPRRGSGRLRRRLQAGRACGQRGRRCTRQELPSIQPAALDWLTIRAHDRFLLAHAGGVSLVRALMLDPDLLLLDEPLGALDPMIRYELQQELKAIFSRLNKTVVLVTHDMAEASYFSDHIVLMREGQIIQSGSFGDLKHAPTEPFVAEFIRAQRQVDEGSQT